MRYPGWATLALVTVLAGCQVSAPLRSAMHGGAVLPTIHFDEPASQALYGKAYDMALDNVFRINTVPADDAHRVSGLLEGNPPMMLRAGGGYPAAWTRDASINSWNAVSLLDPALARNTLFAVIDHDDGGYIIRQDNQQWDQVIWITAAWQHYLVTGDKDFLARAYQIAQRTLKVHHDKAFHAGSGLFMGPSVMNDGIAGYPEPIADAHDSLGGGVFSYPLSSKIAALSTNAIHEEAYWNAGRMARALGHPDEAKAYAAQATDLASAIEKAFWNPQTQRYRYLYAPGISLETEDSQEGLGLAFVILFHLADPSRADAVIAHADIAPFGIADVSPDFKRYAHVHPGRHNNIVWPMTQGFWGSALASRGNAGALGALVSQQAQLAVRSGGFWEIYNGKTGEVDGGWQGDHQWASERDQTWSATAYLRLINEAVFGIHPEIDGLHVTPVLPAGMGKVTLAGLPYRGATLSLTLSGQGARIVACHFDGTTCPAAVSPALVGAHVMDITLAP